MRSVLMFKNIANDEMNLQDKPMSRFVNFNEWIFEIKTIRAIRVSDYGQPYSAMANINIHGESAFVDSLMTKSEQEFARIDAKAISEFLRQLGIEQVQFERFKNNQPRLHSVSLASEPHKEHKAKLVSVG